MAFCHPGKACADGFDCRILNSMASLPSPLSDKSRSGGSSHPGEGFGGSGAKRIHLGTFWRGGLWEEPSFVVFVTFSGCVERRGWERGRPYSRLSDAIRMGTPSGRGGLWSCGGDFRRAMQGPCDG